MHESLVELLLQPLGDLVQDLLAEVRLLFLLPSCLLCVLPLRLFILSGLLLLRLFLLRVILLLRPCLALGLDRLFPLLARGPLIRCLSSFASGFLRALFLALLLPALLLLSLWLIPVQDLLNLCLLPVQDIFLQCEADVLQRSPVSRQACCSCDWVLVLEAATRPPASVTVATSPAEQARRMRHRLTEAGAPRGEGHGRRLGQELGRSWAGA
mmetsp:Transcript_33366/g.100533  ORF Transcript_33366/g.100533 Transcript_33366/m.100533 type:complete len:212 (-) Transcript_33366:16-651(-)